MFHLRVFYALFSLISASAMAGAYSTGPGTGSLVLGAKTYEANSEFRADKKSKSFRDDGKFTKQEIYYYLTYTLTKDWTIVGSGTIYNELKYENNFGKNKFSGSGDQFIAGRYSLGGDDSGSSALQLGATLPIYSRKANPAPGNRQNDVEIRYLKDFYQLLGHSSFVNGEIAYRFRNSSPSDQIRAELNVGKTIDRWLPMFHVNYIKGLKNDSGNSSSVNPNTATDFDL